MLEQLLQLIARGGVHSYRDLARSLNVSQPQLEAMLEDLGRTAYLRQADSACQSTCPECSVGGCAAAGLGRHWVLTVKGLEAANRFPNA